MRCHKCGQDLGSGGHACPMVDQIIIGHAQFLPSGDSASVLAELEAFLKAKGTVALYRSHRDYLLKIIHELKEKHGYIK